MRLLSIAVLMIALGPVVNAEAAPPACIGPEMLRVDESYARPGSGGTFNYLARISNSSMRPIRFDVRFLMNNAQPNRDNSGVQSLPARTFRVYTLGNGLGLSEPIRISQAVRLICR
ncbi:MAG: hypothetical protein JWR10_1571 [Rubritepida sp.]|nr:hypothetical protein [Rubritepida sp.]